MDRHTGRRWALLSVATLVAALTPVVAGQAAPAEHYAEVAKLIGDADFSPGGVDVDGTILAIADPVGGTFGTKATVRIYEESDAGWTLIDEVFGDDAGFVGAAQVDVDADTIALGDARNGYVYLFHRDGPGWTRQAKVMDPGGTAHREFGVGVALSGDTLAIGDPVDPTADTGGNTTSGAVHIFTRSADTWSHQQTVYPGDNSGINEFGDTVALSGDTLVVGNRDVGVAGTVASVFTRVGTTWSLQQEISGTGIDWTLAVAADGDTLAVAMSLGAGGEVRVFARTAEVWALQDTLPATGAMAVALAGDRLVAGAPGYEVAEVYNRSGVTWTLDQTLTWDGPTEPPNPPYTSGPDHFGTEVALSGTTLAVFASLDNDANPVSGGAVRVFVPTTLTCGGQPATKIGTPYADALRGSALDDTIVALGGNDVIMAGSGDDVVCAGNGHDIIEGGPGNDRIFGQYGKDTASYRGAPSGVAVDLIADTASGGDGSDQLYGVEHIDGSPYNDDLRGDGGVNRFVGLGGHDSLTGRGGADLVFGGAGKDTASYLDAPGGVTIDLVAGTAAGAAGNDALAGIEHATGSPFRDVLRGHAGINRLYGMGGNDTLYGLAGNDVLYGRAGYDWAYGGAGIDSCAAERAVGCE